MESLNKAYAQLAEVVRSMAPGTRLTAGALLAVVVVSLAYLCSQPIAGGEAYLLQGHRFTTSEIEAAQAALGEAGLNDYEIEGNQILVPRALKGKYTAALAEGDAMPLHFGTLLTDATTKPGPFTSRPQIDAMNKIALERTLADTIRWMKGIEKAAVLYHLPKKSGFRPDGRATAMVTVVPRGTRELDEGQVPKIRDLVAAAIGIDAADVTVVDANGRSYAGDKSDGTSVLDDPYFSRKKSYEDDYEHKIRKALSYVPGVTVTAHVELEGQVGLREERDAREQMVAPATSFTPKKVMISVGVPDSYYEEIWRKSHPTLDGRAPVRPGNKALELIERTEKAKIQEFVSQSIPRPDLTADVRPLVTVTTFAQLPAVDIPAPATTDRALAWLSSHRSAIAAISLMSVGLFILRSMVRSRQVAGPSSVSRPSTAPEKDKPGKPAAEMPAVAPIQPHNRQRRKPAGGPLLREEFAEMVRDDPEGAAKILRRWIGSAG